jgi:hypothetical protein
MKLKSNKLSNSVHFLQQDTFLLEDSDIDCNTETETKELDSGKGKA